MPNSEKWARFRNTYSHIDVTQFHRGKSNLECDWQRTSTHQDINFTVNGVLVSEHAKQFNNFSTSDGMRSFFKDVLLKDMKGGDAKKQEVVGYMSETFHQGGMLFPVSTAFSTSLLYDDPKDAGKKIPFGAVHEVKRQKINIITTETGIKVQEFAQVDKITLSSDFLKKRRIDTTDPKNLHLQKLNPDPGNNYVALIQATIDVDFSKDSNHPAITVESNTMDFGNSMLKKLMDKRSLGQMIVDFFKNILGLNQVKDISPAIPAKAVVPDIMPEQDSGATAHEEEAEEASIEASDEASEGPTI